MTIDKAIKILDEAQSNLDEPQPAEFAEALQLGIEALKEIKKARNGDPALDGDLLPGETEE